MKTQMITLFTALSLSLALSPFSQAYAQNTSDLVFEFHYRYQNQTLKLKEAAPDRNQALSKAATQCFSYYSKLTPMNEEKGLDIIDECANPR